MGDKKKTILLVDDSNFLRRQIKRFLIKTGYDVVGDAENGEIGLELFKTLEPNLVVLDITMPVRSGFDCLTDIMKISPEAKVVMLSGLSDMSTIEKCLALGAKNYIQKPIDILSEDGKTEFIQKLEQAMSND